MPTDERRLNDILACAEELRTFLEGKDLHAYEEDRVLQRATERLLTVIGEAAKALSEGTRDAIDQPWKAIVRFRDRGIHAYDSLSPPLLFRIAKRSVPALAEAVRAHLARADRGRRAGRQP